MRCCPIFHSLRWYGRWGSCAAWRWGGQRHWRWNLATSPASPNRASSWRISAWFHPSIPVRQHAASGRDYQGRQRCGASSGDRGGLELSHLCPDQPRATPAAGEPGQTDPRHRLKAQERLCRRYRKLIRAGSRRWCTAAIARELAGFVWAIVVQQCISSATDALRVAVRQAQRRSHSAKRRIQSWARLEARSRPGEPSFPLPAESSSDAGR